MRFPLFSSLIVLSGIAAILLGVERSPPNETTFAKGTHEQWAYVLRDKNGFPKIPLIKGVAVIASPKQDRIR